MSKRRDEGGIFGLPPSGLTIGLMVAFQVGGMVMEFLGIIPEGPNDAWNPLPLVIALVLGLVLEIGHGMWTSRKKKRS